MGTAGKEHTLHRSSSLTVFCLSLLAAGCKDQSYNVTDSVGGWGDSTQSEAATDWDSYTDTADPTRDTAEPEDTAEVGDCEGAEAMTLYISPDDSNSMSSPVQARAAILGGYTALSQVNVRTWEFFNYYRFDYPQPEADGELGLSAELVAAPDGSGQFILQIGVKSPELDQRRPMNITLVLDTSGSMGGTPIALLRESAERIAASLQEGDVISMVTWAAQQTPILSGHPVTGPDDPVLLSAIDDISAGGGTDLSGGLTVGYGIAQDNYSPDRINRIVLISDGGANMGVTDENIIGQYAGGQDEDGIYMVGIGVGEEGDYNDILMDAVTDAGKGASVFIPTAAEADLILHQRFLSTMDVYARDVGVSLDLPAGFEIVKFSGEEYSTDPAEIEPQHLAPDDAMVFHQTLAHCDPDSLTGEEVFGVTVKYKDAVTFESRTISGSYTLSQLQESDPSLLYKGAAIYAYAEGLKAWRKGDRESVAVMMTALERAEEHNPGDADLAEIRSVISALE
jgi:Ca-activated chloride channel family protein